MIRFWEAVDEIKSRRGVSDGKAQSMLRQACASGEIRSEKEPYSVRGLQTRSEGPPEPIEPSEWRKHEIDVMTTLDGCRYWVKVDKADFEFWLNTLEFWLDAPAKPKRNKAPSQSALASEAVRAIWQELPDHVHGSEMHRRGSEWIAKHHPEATLPSLSVYARLARKMRSGQPNRS
jgi:hypothetical protein